MLEAWKDAKQARQRIEDESAGLPEADANRHLAIALTAVGEATYAQAEEERARTELVTIPVFKGEPTKDPLLAFIQRDVAPWVKNKQGALEKTEAAYRKVVQIEPAPPPRWVMDSAEHVGSMWDGFAADLKSVACPERVGFTARCGRGVPTVDRHELDRAARAIGLRGVRRDQ